MNNKQSVTKRFVTLYIISAVLTCAAAAVSFIFIREIGAIHFILIGLAVISIIIAVYGIVSLKSAVVRPLSRIVGALKQVLGGQPDPNFIVKDASGEFIELSDLVRRALQRMYGDIELLGKVRNGDYSFDFESVHEEDGLIFALSGMIDRQRKLVSGLKMVSNQITIASGEIEGGSQSLASGSNQQALAVEQFRASVESLSIKASDNAASAREAIEAIQANTKIVDDIANDLKIMTKTMNDIDESAKRISKVSDVIENIAFQTNILALNAAVEAARAGQHGKGFAVVADEVRDLSNKSAEAARETAELIRADLANVEIGNKIAENAVTGMENISNLSAQNEERMVALTESSIAQSNSIKEISDGISQISQIIQSNAALAEQSAAASTELTTQAAELDKLVEVYKLKE